MTGRPITAAMRKHIESVLFRIEELEGKGYRDPATDPDHGYALGLFYTQFLEEIRRTIESVLPEAVSRQLAAASNPTDGDLHAIAEVRGVLQSVALALEEVLEADGAKSLGPGTDELIETLRARKLPTIEVEFSRALRSTMADPPLSITAANAMVEALCKVHIDDYGLPAPKRQQVRALWGVVSSDLRMRPDAVDDSDLKKILSGLISVVEGLGSLRTHSGSAHGKGRRTYRPEPRHARLAVLSASALVDFVIHTWDSDTTRLSE